MRGHFLRNWCSASICRNGKPPSSSCCIFSNRVDRLPYVSECKIKLHSLRPICPLKRRIDGRSSFSGSPTLLRSPMRYCRISATSLAALAVTALSAHAQTTPVEPTDAVPPTAPTQPATPVQPAAPTQPATALPAVPAEKTNQLERVEITGSSIKRIAAETALPV